MFQKIRNSENLKAIRWISRTVGRNKSFILLLIPLQILLSVLTVGYALLLKLIVDYAVEKNAALFVRYALFLVLLMVGRMLLLAFLRFFWEWSTATVENSIKLRVYGWLVQRDYASVKAVHTGEWMNRLTDDVTTVAKGVIDIIPDSIASLATLVCTVGAFVMIEPRFLKLLLPCLVFVLVITALMRKRMKRLHKAVRAADGKVRSYLQEHLGSLLVLKAFGREEVSRGEAEQLLGGYKRTRMQRNRFSNLCNSGYLLLVWGATVGAVIYCGHGLLTATMTFGTMTALLNLVSKIQEPFVSLSGYVSQYFSTVASAERLMEIEAFPAEEPCTKTAGELAAFYRDSFTGFGLDNVSFAYRDADPAGRETAPEVLQNLSCHVAKGDIAAFTGQSGCGKSTVFKLLMAIYPVDSGERYLQTVSGREVLDSTWRGLFAYVPQGNQLMSGTIRDAVTFGLPENPAALQAALTVACADEFIGELEQGVDTVLGEYGAGLSEGQLQRLAIARAVFSGRPILLLDEATSALDAATEKQILQNIRQMTDRTVLIVTHRPAALEICNKVLGF